MFALLAIASVVSSASDPVAIALSSKWPGTETVGQKLAAELQDALGRAELTVLSDAQTREKAKAVKAADPRTCNGVRGCMLKLALALGEHVVVVGIDVVKLSDRLVVRVEVLRADHTEPLDTLEINTTTRGWSNDSVVPLNQLARRLQERLQPPPPPPSPSAKASDLKEPREDAPREQPVASAPAAASAEPKPAVDRVEPAYPPPSRLRPVAFIFGGVGLGSLVASGVTLGLGFSGRGSILSTYSTDPDGHTVSTLRRSDLDARVSAANTQLIISAIAGAVGAALLATAIALLLGS